MSKVTNNLDGRSEYLEILGSCHAQRFVDTLQALRESYSLRNAAPTALVGRASVHAAISGYDGVQIAEAASGPRPSFLEDGQPEPILKYLPLKHGPLQEEW